MSVLNHKNQYIASGAIKSIAAIVERPYTSREGENKIWRTREFVIRNKYSKNGRWHITDIPFIASGDVVDALNYLVPGQEVVVNWSFDSKVYMAKDGSGERYWVTMRAWGIISPKDKIVNEKWWSHVDKQKVRGGEEYESPTLPTEEEKKRKRPATKAYDKDTFSITTDYSEKKEEDEIPF